MLYQDGSQSEQDLYQETHTLVNCVGLSTIWMYQDGSQSERGLYQEGHKSVNCLSQSELASAGSALALPCAVHNLFHPTPGDVVGKVPAASFSDISFVLTVSQPLTSELGTYKTVKARFWPWLSGTSPQKVFKLFPLRSEAVSGVE